MILMFFLVDVKAEGATTISRELDRVEGSIVVYAQISQLGTPEFSPSNLINIRYKVVGSLWKYEKLRITMPLYM